MASSSDPKLAKQVASASGCEMRATGINWVYSPVADVNSDPMNPVIGIRAFGEGKEGTKSCLKIKAEDIFRTFQSSRIRVCRCRRS